MDIHWKQEYTGDMEVKKRDGVTYLSYPRLERESAIVHGFSTRLGGVSEGCLGSMNLSFSRGDNPENVLENYRRISRAIHSGDIRSVESSMIMWKPELCTAELKCLEESQI